MSKEQKSLPELQVVSFLRAAPVEIERKKTGDGRTVEAYAAVFNRTARITGRYWISEDFWTDDWGTYDELIRQGAFKKTLNESAKRAQYLFNHGCDIYGSPSDRYSMPPGVPVEMSEDSTGLLTVSRMSKTPLGDELLELIDDGAIRAYSFQGKAIRSTVTRATRDGDVDLVERHEIALKEYGPCVFPAYDDAEILAVRTETIIDKIRNANLSPEERQALIRQLQDTPPEASTAPAAGSEGDEPSAPGTPTQAAPAPVEEGPSADLLRLEQLQRQRIAAL